MLGLKGCVGIVLGLGLGLAGCGDRAIRGEPDNGGDAAAGEGSTGELSPGADGGSGGGGAISSAGTTAATSTGGATMCDEGDEGLPGFGGESTGGGSGAAEDSGFGMGDIPLVTNVPDVRGGAVASGEFVEIADVVVSAPAGFDQDGAGLVFVQDPAGGPDSGIPLHADFLAEVADLLPGDIVTIRGRVLIHNAAFILQVTADIDHRVTLNSSGPPPDPFVVTPDMIAPGQALATSLESVLVRVQTPQVVNAFVCGGEVEVDNELHIDNRYLDGDVPLPPDGVYDAVTGPLIRTVDALEVAPRSAEDLEF